MLPTSNQIYGNGKKKIANYLCWFWFGFVFVRVYRPCWAAHTIYGKFDDSKTKLDAFFSSSFIYFDISISWEIKNMCNSKEGKDTVFHTF